jgi:Ni/Co efflux regulator RcnB
MIVLGVLIFIFVLLPDAKLQQEREDADTRAWKQKQAEHQRQDEDAKRLRDAINAFHR